MNALEVIQKDIETGLNSIAEAHRYATQLWRAIEAETNGNEEWIPLAKAEAIALQLVPTDGECIPIFIHAGVTRDDAIKHAFSQLDAVGLDHLAARASHTKNISLRAHYSHVLWKSTRKHQSHASRSVESYVELAEKFFEQATSVEKETDQSWFPGLAMIDSACNAFYIAGQSGLDKKVIADRIAEWVPSAPNCSSQVAIRRQLLDLIVDHPRDFRGANRDALCNVCFAQANELRSKRHFQVAVDFYNIGQRLDAARATNWTLLIAGTWEEASVAAGENLLGCDFCDRAIQAYKTLRNDAKVSELIVRLAELRKGIKLEKIEHKVDGLAVTQYFEKCKQIALRLSQAAPQQIVQYISLAPVLLPKAERIQKMTNEFLNNSILWQIAHIEVLDERGNKAKNVTTEEWQKHGFWNSYRLSIEYEATTLLDMILTETISNEKITAEALLTEICENSWITETITYELPGEKKVSYTWAEILKPLFETYIDARRASDPGAQFKLMLLFIDSATLKIESMLRDIGLLMGLPTLMVVREKDFSVQRERDISNLLGDARILDTIGEDLANYLKFVFTEQSGMRTRHRVAHGLMFPQEYHRLTADRVFIAIVRLCGFSLVKPDEEN